MEYAFENIVHDSPLPFKIFFHSVRSCSSHWHRELEILFVLKGSVLVQIEGTQFLLNEGNLFLANSGEIHLTHETEETNIILAFQLDPAAAIQFDPEFGDRKFFCNSQTDSDPSRSGNYDTLRNLLARIMFTMREKGEGYAFQAASAVNSLLMLLVQCFQISSPVSGVQQSRIEENSRYFSRLSRIIRYIDRHYTEKISASELAEKENINPSYLSRFFHDKVGCTFGEYVAFVRLQKSLKTLRTTDWNISDIALEYGFPSVKAYNTAFKKTFNTTPSAWRAEKAAYEQPLPTPAAGGAGYNPYGDFNRDNAVKILNQWLEKGA